MSKRRIVWASIASTIGVAAVFFLLRGKQSSEFDRVSMIGLVSFVVGSLWWNKVTDHRAYGMGLLFCASAITFAHSWIMRGLFSQETLFCGILSILILLVVVAICRGWTPWRKGAAVGPGPTNPK